MGSMIGRTFGNAVVVGFTRRPNTKNPQYLYKYRCLACGELGERHASVIRRAAVVCRTCAKAAMAPNPAAATRHPLYATWRAMLNRCGNPKNPGYKNYGGRGITVCAAWACESTGFSTFVADMGERPAGLTLERRNNDLGYSKSNCYWATYAAQTKNRRPLRSASPVWAELVVVRGIEMTFGAWCAAVGVRPAAVLSALRRKNQSAQQYVGQSRL